MSKGPSGAWVIVPAVITLVVTAVRVWGELAGWPAEWFGTVPGGMRSQPTAAEPAPLPSLFGIFWLIPLFGIWFAARLRLAGDAPPRRGRAVWLALAGLVLVVGPVVAIGIVSRGSEPSYGFLWSIAGAGAVAVAGMFVAGAGWASFFKMQLLYAVLARGPIVVLTFVLCHLDAGTHYEKLAPFAPAGLGNLERAVWLSVSQLFFWVPLTVAFGAVMASVVAFVVPRGK